MPRFSKRVRSYHFVLGVIHLFIVPVCDNDDHGKWGYPWWYIRLPSIRLTKTSLTIGWAILLSRTIELSILKTKEEE